MSSVGDNFTKNWRSSIVAPIAFITVDSGFAQ